MRYDLIAIGTSLGGLRALSALLGALPASFAIPIAIVQHRSIESAPLCAFLQSYCAMPVREASDKLALEPGCVYLAPAGYHMLVEPGALALSTEAPVWSARPAIDVLFESVADSYGARAVGAILTGASHDGAQGLARIKRRGGLAVVQSPATAECPVMPEAAIAAGPVDHILPIDGIAALLLALPPNERAYATTGEHPDGRRPPGEPAGA